MRHLKCHILTAPISKQASVTAKSQLKEVVRNAISKTEIFIIRGSSTFKYRPDDPRLASTRDQEITRC